MKTAICFLVSFVLAALVITGVRLASADALDAGTALIEPMAAGSAAVAPAPAVLPDPVAAPVESASLIVRLYKAGHLVPVLIVFAFFLLVLLQKWVAWLRTGYRKLVVSSALVALAMLAERAAEGTTPNLLMLMGAFGAAFTLYIKGGGEPAAAKA